MAATPQAKIQNGFHPMLPGFAHAELNNIDSFAAAIDTDTAVFIESIQGEGAFILPKIVFYRSCAPVRRASNLANAR